jgi:hypothetical protein
VVLVSLGSCLRRLWCRGVCFVCLFVWLFVCMSWSIAIRPALGGWSESESYRRVGLFALVLLFLEGFETVVLCRSRVLWLPGMGLECCCRGPGVGICLPAVGRVVGCAALVAISIT